jgi:hypothetical protein
MESYELEEIVDGRVFPFNCGSRNRARAHHHTADDTTAAVCASAGASTGALGLCGLGVPT